MGYTIQNAEALKKISSKTMVLATKISDDVRLFNSNSRAVGDRCEEFWPQIESSIDNATRIARESSEILLEYAKLMDKVSDRIIQSVSGGKI